MKRAILYSGGLDSVWLRQNIIGAELIYFNFGTSYTTAELVRLPDNCRVIDVGNVKEFGREKEIHNRNLMMITYLSLTYQEIYIGSTAEDKKYDNTQAFFNGLFYILRNCKIITPLINNTKQDIYNSLKASNKSTDFFSCYNPVSVKPCGVCAACLVVDDLVQFELVSFNENDLPELHALNKSALIETGIYDANIIDDFEICDNWLTMKHNGKIIGMIGSINGEGVKLRVHHDYRRKGFGKLLKDIIKKEVGLYNYFSTIHVNNLTAIHLNEKEGMIKSKTVENGFIKMYYPDSKWDV